MNVPWSPIIETCIFNWLGLGLISNIKKSEAMLIGSNPAVNNTRKLPIVLEGEPLKQSEHFKYLGVNMDSRL
jgi:hypothetical protein